MMMSSSVMRKAFVISRFAEKDLPLPGVPKISPLGFLSLLAVKHDHVVGQCVQPVVQSFAALKQLLRGEGDENCCAGSGQPR